MKKILIGISSVVFGVNVALAQINVTVGTANNNVGGSLHSLIAVIQGLVNQLSVLAYGVATLAFFWFLIQLIAHRGDPTKTANAWKGIGWSVGSLFLMYAIFGVIGFISSIVGVGVGGSIPVPSIPTGPTQ